MNFDEAVVAHSAWKRKLAAYLAKPDKSIDAAKLEKDNNCELGKWIETQQAIYASNKTFGELRRKHTDFHRAAADVVRRADAGQSVSAEVTLGGNSPYANSSSQVVQALMQMKQASSPTIKR